MRETGRIIRRFAPTNNSPVSQALDRMVALLEYAEIENEVNRLACLIDAPKNLLPTYQVSKDFAHPHIEIAEDQYHFVVVERGVEYERKSTRSPNQLMFWVFSGVTGSMAFDYELKNRVPDQDCRRIAFPKKVSLMFSLGEELGKLEEYQVKEVLSRAPYDDETTEAINRMGRSNAI